MWPSLSGGFWLGSSGGTATVPAGVFLQTTTGAFLSSGGVWTNNSDRYRKSDFTPVDEREILDQIAQMPIASWRYKADQRGVRHVGPTAQDFRAAFGLGEDDKHISTVDAEGVALAAIQALYQLGQEKDREIDELTRKVNELESRMARLAQR